MKPLLICMTPVKNEAWILDAFLKATSLWADHIIIADQGSTDGSREIAQSFSKVIFVDNLSQEMHQANTRKLLFDKTKEIAGDKIVFALDADEFFAGSFLNSDGWQKIINSNVGDVFCFKWMNLIDTAWQFIKGQDWMYWACHVNDDIWEGKFPDNYIHEWRLPWPDKVPNDRQFYLDDLKLLHFARANRIRQRNKTIFYQVITKYKQPEMSVISLFRSYNNDKIKEIHEVPAATYDYYLENGIDLIKEIKFDDIGNHYISESIKYIKEKGGRYYQGLDIWDKDFLALNNIKDPRSIRVKLIHYYLRKTNHSSKMIFIRIVDKLLKLAGI